jgi:phosphate starvation-inducible protein PhoH and related proteins
MVESKFEIDDISIYRKICGSNDANIRKIEKLIDVTIIPRGNTLIIKADKSKSDRAIKLLHLMSDYLFHADGAYEFNDFDIRYLSKSVLAGISMKPDELNRLKITIQETGKTIIPRTYNQGRYMSSVQKDPISFGIGPAGTGKTFLAVVLAMDYFQKGKIEKVILTRPAVEAGESLGYLPGDLKQKINPYLRPLYDALFDLITYEKMTKLMEREQIEIAPLAYMRGRTLNNAFIILDEAQNTTHTQMKMFLTRLGANSKMVVTGDVTQIDLSRPGQSGLLHAKKILSNIDGIGFTYFTKDDISRHPVVEKIVSAYESKTADRKKQ